MEPPQTQSNTIDGVARCARYAFGPNRLHLCGPDINREVLAYVNEGISDQGLNNILKNFQTLFPYLQQIASANRIKDPLDNRVVEAYWLGNSLLNMVPPKTFYKHLTGNLHLDKRLNAKTFTRLKDKLSLGALMHHSFHVFNVWRRTGRLNELHTLDSMDNCRISCGKVLAVDGPVITVSRQPLLLAGNQLTLGKPQSIKIIRQLEGSTLIDEVKVNNLLSIHWNQPCEIISQTQANNLKHYTSLSLSIATTPL